MGEYHVILEAAPTHTYRTQRAANSLDLDLAKKLRHELRVTADLETPYALGVIVGASGSGKTSLARHIWGDRCADIILEPDLPIIEQFPATWEYDRCAEALLSIGLSAVPCWVRPAKTLSNGQRARAEAALKLAAAEHGGTVVIDEWTSVVDRTVAKAMSHCAQRHARRHAGEASLVLCTCHYDVLDWLNPDWVIDCNTGLYADRRLLCRVFQRSERLVFDVRPVDRSTWQYFSKYHYLSDQMAVNTPYTFGLFHGLNQMGFIAFSNYVPHRYAQQRRREARIVHFNRVVIHPDYVGLGLGIRLINVTSQHVASLGERVMGKFSSLPVYRAMIRDHAWRLTKTGVDFKKTNVGKRMGNAGKAGFRNKVRTFVFQYIGPTSPLALELSPAEIGFVHS